MRSGRPAQHQRAEVGGGRGARRPWLLPTALGLLIALGLTACAETLTKRGHQFHDNDLKQIQPGMSQEQVKTSLGTPTTTATIGSGSAYYYISSTEGDRKSVV